MGTTLIVKGTLRGMGCEVDCSLIATRSDSMQDGSAPFTKCAILDAPLWLPDGYYEASFGDQSAFLHRVNGVWSVGVPWRHGHGAPAERREPAMIRPAPVPIRTTTE